MNDSSRSRSNNSFLLTKSYDTNSATVSEARLEIRDRFPGVLAYNTLDDDRSFYLLSAYNFTSFDWFEDFFSPVLAQPSSHFTTLVFVHLPAPALVPPLPEPSWAIYCRMVQNIPPHLRIEDDSSSDY